MNAPGQIITFYSYKGGVGRSMALANISCVLARQAKRGVLVVDWDLEAPGLHRFFDEGLRLINPGLDLETSPGLLELLDELRSLVGTSSNTKEEPATEFENYLRKNTDLNRYILRTAVVNVHLLKAGRFDRTYSERVSTFAWAEMYSQAPWIFSWLGNLLAERFDYVLIDSRTGVTDTSGICTAILPEKLVAVFTPNRQSLEGVLELLSCATAYRRTSDDLRPLLIFPLPSRIEPTMEKLRYYWRFDAAVGYQPRFESLFQEAYKLSNCDLTAYFDEVQIQHVPDYAYGEKIATLDNFQSTDRFSLPRSYEAFTDRLISGTAPWESPALVFHSVFISYDSRDQQFAERLHSDLAARGVRTWFAPSDVKIGDRFRTEIDEAIRVHDKLLVILSENSIKSPWVEHEVEIAFERERGSNKVTLFPIRLDDSVMATNSDWAAALRRVRHIGDFSDWKHPVSYKSAFERLLRDLKASGL